MEAIEFLKEYARMCNECKACYECPLKGTTCSIGEDLSEEQMINIVDKTEQWSIEHPTITNIQKFKEVFGVLPTDYVMGRSRETWWDKPYKEPKE